MIQSNILAKCLPEIKDLPLQYKVVLAGPGTLLGEEDVFCNTQYRSSVRCYSVKASLYEMPAENFMLLKNQDHAWKEIFEKVVSKEKKLNAWHLTSKPVQIAEQDKDLYAIAENQ